MSTSFHIHTWKPKHQLQRVTLIASSSNKRDIFDCDAYETTKLYVTMFAHRSHACVALKLNSLVLSRGKHSSLLTVILLALPYGNIKETIRNPNGQKKLGKFRANINGVVVSMFIFSQPRGDVMIDLKVMISVMQLRSRWIQTAINISRFERRVYQNWHKNPCANCFIMT